MRIVFDAFRKCWIMITFHYTKDSHDSDVDEGPLTKHRRLASDYNPRFLNMDGRGNKDTPSGGVSKSSCGVSSAISTREIGILCSVPRDTVSVNDKCIMVGTTGIAALKAKYGDDFTNFEIIQDVGYSSESSTHLSSDDVSDHIRIYSYTPTKRPYNSDLNGNNNLSRGTEYSMVSGIKLFGHSSLGSNSSHNDSGFGALEPAVEEISPEGLDEEYLSSSPGVNGDYPESDFLDSVNFPNISECENEHTDYGLDGMDSSESLDNFQNRSSFASSTHAFYKMTSVDSDYGDHKTSQEKESLRKYLSTDDELEREKSEVSKQNNPFQDANLRPTTPIPKLTLVSSENNFLRVADSKDTRNSEKAFSQRDNHASSEQNITSADISGLSDIECLPLTPCKTSSDPQDSDISEEFLLHRRYSNNLCSTPYVCHSSHHQKQQPKNHRKGRRRRLSIDESYDSAKNTNWDNLLCSCPKNKSTRSNRVREWLKHCSDGKSSSSGRRTAQAVTVSDESASGDHHRSSPLVVIDTTVDSSCDASGEYTTTESDDESADYGGGSHTRSGSGMGSVETVVPRNITNFRERHLTGSHDGTLSESLLLLPPPPPPTPPIACVESAVSITSSKKDGNCEKPIRSISEGDLSSTKMKSYRMRHFNDACSAALSGTNSSINPEFIVPCMSTFRRSSESRRNTRLWRRSLPIILCSESGHSSSDAPSQLKSSGTLTSLGYSSDISHWKKSLSGGSTRRSRKRSSSSSKCSSRSINFINRHHGSRTTISATRGRHFSQASGSQVNEAFFSSEENQGTKATSENIPKNMAVHVNEGRVCIRRSPETDVILTQFEEQSTASDQVWDGYQEMPYLSEAYSEPTVDEDAVRKLTEFGDDYCSAIGSQPHSLISNGGIPVETSTFSPEPSSYYVKTTTCSPTVKTPNSPVDSDSDIEDLHDILTETCRALQFARNTLNCRRDGRVLNQAENAELLATCQTHLRCLEVICEHIEIDGKEKSFSHEDLVRLHDLIEEWAALQRIVVMNQQQELQSCDDKVHKAQKNIDDLFNKMAELSSTNHLNPQDISSLDDLRQKMETIQMALSTLQETKEQLLAVNIQVHRIVTESGDTSSPLKQEITDLYQQWEDAYEENGNQLTDLQLLYNRWQLYEKNYQELISRIREEQKCLITGCGRRLSDDEGEETGRIEDLLKELQIDAGFLECRLKSSIVWTEISRDLQQLHSQIQQLKHQQRHHSGSSVEDLRASPFKSHKIRHHDIDYDDEEQESEVNQKAMEDSKPKPEDEDLAELPVEATDQRKKSSASPSRLWRVLRAALPIQLALVLLYCLACALEPHCCDLLNNFNFSLSPQLRYVRGPPPI